MFDDSCVDMMMVLMGTILIWMVMIMIACACVCCMFVRKCVRAFVHACACL